MSLYLLLSQVNLGWIKVKNATFFYFQPMVMWNCYIVYSKCYILYIYLSNVESLYLHLKLLLMWKCYIFYFSSFSCGNVTYSSLPIYCGILTSTSLTTDNVEMLHTISLIIFHCEQLTYYIFNVEMLLSEASCTHIKQTSGPGQSAVIIHFNTFILFFFIISSAKQKVSEM